MKVLGIALGILAFIVMSALAMEAFADPLLGASRQRIGNYDFEIATEPERPDAGKPAKIMLRFAGVNGDDLVDVPVTIRIEKAGTEIYRTNPIVVPYGHHNFEFTFPEPGSYALYADLTDYAYSGQTLTFTFPMNAWGPVDYISQMLPLAGGLAAAAIGAAVVIKKKKMAAR